MQLRHAWGPDGDNDMGVLLRAGKAGSSDGPQRSWPKTYASSPAQTRTRQTHVQRQLTCRAGVDRTAFSYETALLTKIVCTRAALKTCLNYLSETNGELHFFLHTYIAEHPLTLNGTVDPDEWLAQLACSPLTQVSDPRRSSVVSAASLAAATQGQRSVSPRDAVERILSLREHIAKEMQEELGGMASANSNVMRMALQKTYTELKLPDLGQ